MLNMYFVNIYFRIIMFFFVTSEYFINNNQNIHNRYAKHRKFGVAYNNKNWTLKSCAIVVLPFKTMFWFLDVHVKLILSNLLFMSWISLIQLWIIKFFWIPLITCTRVLLSPSKITLRFYVLARILLMIL